MNLDDLKKNICPECGESFKEGLTISNGYFLRHKCKFMIIKTKYMDIVEPKKKEVDTNGGEKN